MPLAFRDRPERCSGLPWGARPIDETETVSALGICSISHEALRSIDYALRVALLAALPIAWMAYNSATQAAFITPSIALIAGIVIPTPRVGASLNLLQQVLAAIVFQQATSYAIVAVDPSQHVAAWFAVYVVLSVIVAFTTSGLVTKLMLYFLNFIMVTEYNRGDIALPKGETDRYVFASRFGLAILIGAAIGTIAAFFPYPRTSRDDAERALRAAFHGIAICFGGVSDSLYIPGPRPAVQRRVNVRRIAAARTSVERHLQELEAALAGMRFEAHSAVLQDRLAGRLAVAREAMSGIDGLYGLVSQITRHPGIIDEIEASQRWGRWMAPKLLEVSHHVEDFCARAGDASYEMQDADMGSLDRLRDGLREALESARQRSIRDGARSGAATPSRGGGMGRRANSATSFGTTTDVADLAGAQPSGVDLLHLYQPTVRRERQVFPFLQFGFFALCIGRFLRTLSSVSTERDIDDARVKKAEEQRTGRSSGEESSTHGLAHGSGLAPPSPDSPHRTVSMLPIEPTPMMIPSRAPVSPSPTSVAATEPFPADAALPAEVSGDDDDGAVNQSFFIRTKRSPLITIDPIEPLYTRFLLYWPRCWAAGSLQFRALLSGDEATLLKLREAAKLVFAMATALGIILAFGTRLPAGGASTIAFVKDANSAATMVASLDYIAATIIGSVYGFIAVSITASRSELIAAMCIVVVIPSYVRAHPRYSTPAFLVSFFALSAMAPGFANADGLLATVKQNVLSMTWLVITHAVLWPAWPHQQVRTGVIDSVTRLHEAVTTLLEAIETTDRDEAKQMTFDVAEKRGPLRQGLEKLRAQVQLAAREPSLRRDPFADREHLRVVDALDAVASLLFPVAAATAFINELPPAPRRHPAPRGQGPLHKANPAAKPSDDVADDDKNGDEEEDVDSGDDTFVPLKVLECLRKDTDSALENVDCMFRALRSMWDSTVDVSDTVLQALADSVDSLEKCVRDGSRVYYARLERSVDARPYEMSAINTIMHFYSTLSAALNYLVEAAVDARRAAIASGLSD